MVSSIVGANDGVGGGGAVYILYCAGTHPWVAIVKWRPPIRINNHIGRVVRYFDTEINFVRYFFFIIRTAPPNIRIAWCSSWDGVPSIKEGRARTWVMLNYTDRPECNIS